MSVTIKQDSNGYYYRTYIWNDTRAIRLGDPDLDDVWLFSDTNQFFYKRSGLVVGGTRAFNAPNSPAANLFPRIMAIP